MKRSWLLIVCLGAFTTPGFAQTPEFPELAYLQLPRGKANTPRPFPWPRVSAFQEAWQGTNTARLVRVLEADIEGKGEAHTVLLALTGPEDAVRVTALGGKTEAASEASERIAWGSPWRAGGELKPGAQYTLRTKERTVALKVRRISPKGRVAPCHLWTAWTYVAVLLGESPAKEGEFTIPMGSCSMDTAPQQAARKHAETCFEAGRMGCFLNFQIMIMGDQFNRLAWSSYGERAHHTQSERLLDAGLDLERFFRGLLARYDTDEPRERELGTWRLARAVAELGPSALPGSFARIANDERLDEYNRLRATQALVYLEIAKARAKQQDVDLDSITKHVKDNLPKPSWASEAWLETLAAR